jgi:hypothetical protein
MQETASWGVLLFYEMHNFYDEQGPSKSRYEYQEYIYQLLSK